MEPACLTCSPHALSEVPAVLCNVLKAYALCKSGHPSCCLQYLKKVRAVVGPRGVKAGDLSEPRGVNELCITNVPAGVRYARLAIPCPAKEKEVTRQESL